MVAALIPIVLIEALVFRHRLDLNYKQSLLGSAAGNAISTVAGVPLSWGLMFLVLIGASFIDLSLPLKWQHSPAGALAYVVLNAAWLAPFETHLNWMIPTALAVLLIPSYFFSVLIEFYICKQVWKNTDRNQLRQAVRAANGITYGILEGICLVLIIRA